MFWRFLIPSHGRTFNVSKLHTARSASAAWDKVSLLQCFAFLFFSAAFPAYGLGYGFNLGKVKRCFGGDQPRLLLAPAPRGDRASCWNWGSRQHQGVPGAALG